jgi:CheY-like chemotaxis protein
MTTTGLPEITADYTAALRDYLAGAQESALVHAYEIGRRAIEGDLGLLDVMAAHQTALAAPLISAVQGRLGTELATEHRPDLILLDLNFPDISGEEVLRRLKEDPRTRGIPVVVISADTARRQIEAMLEAGAHDYISKPLDVPSFLAVVDEILGRG